MDSLLSAISWPYPDNSFLAQFSRGLQERGFTEVQAKEVLELFIAGELNDSMAHRWLEDPAGYSTLVYRINWVLLCTYALKYIDDKLSGLAWFRPCFLPPDVQQAKLAAHQKSIPKDKEE